MAWLYRIVSTGPHIRYLLLQRSSTCMKHRTVLQIRTCTESQVLSFSFHIHSTSHDATSVLVHTGITLKHQGWCDIQYSLLVLILSNTEYKARPWVMTGHNSLVLTAFLFSKTLIRVELRFLIMSTYEPAVFVACSPSMRYNFFMPKKETRKSARCSKKALAFGL